MAVLDTLWLTNEQATKIVAQAAASPDEEVCGLLFGRVLPSQPLNQPMIDEIVLIDNVAADRATRYEMNPVQFVNAYASAAAAGRELLAIYHSHVSSPPIPSETDVAEAQYPDAVYLIVRLIGGEARFAAWSITAAEVLSVPLHIGDHAPSFAAVSPVLSPAQKFSVILSAVLAAVFLLAVSLTLLPPAPPLPN